MVMQHRTTTSDGPEFISLQRACRKVGISVQAAVKLPPEEGLGNRRVVPRRQFEAWLARQLGENVDE